MSKPKGEMLESMSVFTKTSLLGGKEQRLSQIPQLPDEELFDYKGLVKGNDPFELDHIIPHRIAKPFVFVGTSLFGALDLACSLAVAPSHHAMKPVPKLIIVDSSKQVADCWEKIKEYFSEIDPSSFRNVGNFLYRGSNSFMDFLLEELYEQVRDLDHKSGDYFMNFFSKHGIDFVKQVITDAVCIKQSWANAETFTTIKDVYSHLPIVAYPSNIISFIDDTDVRIGVLRCIDILQPELCLFSNLEDTGSGKRPTETFLASMPFEVNEIAHSLAIEERLAVAPEDINQAQGTPDTASDVDEKMDLTKGAGSTNGPP